MPQKDVYRAVNFPTQVTRSKIFSSHHWTRGNQAILSTSCLELDTHRLLCCRLHSAFEEVDALHQDSQTPLPGRRRSSSSSTNCDSCYRFVCLCQKLPNLECHLLQGKGNWVHSSTQHV